MVRPENRMKRHAVCVLAFGAVGLGCSSHRENDEVSAISSDGILVCGTTPPASEAHGPVTEWYSVTAMHNKLRHFPAFARTSAVRKVTNCAEARSLYRAYVSYSEAHPHFDAQEALEGDNLPDPPVPAGGTREAQVEKILNGVDDILNPVVTIGFEGISADGGKFTRVCSGTFIARNWIMTAAHCLQVASRWKQGDGSEAAKIHRWYDYQVGFAGVINGQRGVLVRSVRLPRVLQYMDGRYLGFDVLSLPRPIEHDFALLYVHDDSDNVLPNNAPNLPAGQGPIMRVGLSPAISGSASAWGWGEPGILTSSSGFLGGFNFQPDRDAGEGVVSGTVPPDPAPRVCKGDSGGPIVDRFDVLNPATGNMEIQPAAVALFSAAIFPDAGVCPDPGAKEWWVLTVGEIDLITKKIPLWYPNFFCRTGGFNGPQFIECWGKPCLGDNECDSDQTCVHPGSRLKNCNPPCPAPGGSCDCYYGQCLPTNVNR